MSAKLEKVNIIPHDDGANVPALQAVTPMDMLNRAVTSGADIDMIEKLMTLQERWDANQARKAFDEAMANAQGEMPALTKNRLVNYASAKSPTGFVTYRHEDLAEIVETVKPVLKKFGLSHRFRTAQEGDKITVTCIITGHGHREENSLSAGRDTSGGKNNHQEIASAVTYLERYTLKAALGLAAAHDDDGKAADAAAEVNTSPPPPGSITQAQVDQIRDLLESLGVNGRAFVAWVKQSRADVRRVEEIPAEYFEACVTEIKRVAAARK